MCNTTAATPVEFIEEQFSSYNKLLKVICWIRRLAWCMRNKPRRPQHYFSTLEAREATQLLLHRSQLRSFSKELKHLKANPPKDISRTSPILNLRPRVDDHGTLRVGGRLSNANIPEHDKHPTIISAKDHFTKLLFRHYHLQLGHCGPTALLSHASNLYHVVGARRLARDTCSKCVTCRAAAARVSTQLFGQLPPETVEPDYVFQHTGMDLAGPFIIKKGHTRKPVEVKAFLLVFICFCTKAVHLELVSDMSTAAFIAALERFVSRRGLPLHLHSDNGRNFL